jgi:hypothetical protein
MADTNDLAAALATVEKEIAAEAEQSSHAPPPQLGAQLASAERAVQQLRDNIRFAAHQASQRALMEKAKAQAEHDRKVYEFTVTAEEELRATLAEIDAEFSRTLSEFE